MRFIEGLRGQKETETERARRYLEMSGIKQLFQEAIASGKGTKIIDRSDLGFYNNASPEGSGERFEEGAKIILVIRENTFALEPTFDAIGVHMTHEASLTLIGKSMIIVLTREEWTNNRKAMENALWRVYDSPASYKPSHTVRAISTAQVWDMIGDMDREIL